MLKIQHTVCPSCSVGCGIDIISKDGEVVGTFPYKRNVINEGKNCLNGRNSIECFESRILTPLVSKRSSDLSEALKIIADELKNSNPDEIGVICSGNNSNEEIIAIKEFANKMGYKIGFSSDNFPNYDGELARYDDVDNAKDIYLIGDVVYNSPLVGRRVFHALDNGASILAIGTEDKGVTALNFEFTLVDHISDYFNDADIANDSIIIINEIDSSDEFEIIKSIAEKTNSKLLPIFSKCNTKGVLSELEANPISDVIESSSILLVFGEDEIEDLTKVKKIFTFSAHENDVTDASEVVIPIKFWIENGGSFTNAMGDVQNFVQILDAPEGILSGIEIVEKLQEKV